MKAIATIGTILLALAAAGCGSRSGTTTTATVTVSNPAGSATSTAPGTTGTTTVPSTTSTSTVAGATVACTAAQLTPSYLGQQGATGHGELGFALTNSSSTACHTFGYPGVLFLSKSGATLPTQSTRTTRDFFGETREQRIEVAPGGSFSFRIGVTHGVTSPADCTTAAALQIIAPDDTRTMRVSIPEGAYECRTATVSPVQPGPTAYP